MEKIKKYLIFLLVLSILLSLVIAVVACEKEFFHVGYRVTEGGEIVSGIINQEVMQGGSSEEVTVAPLDGYEFKEWSDGNKNLTRHEENVQENTILTAVFVKRWYTLNFSAGNGGTITGTVTQVVEFDSPIAEVTAVADEGFLFAGWSDGICSETRNEKANKDIDATALFVSKTKVLNYACDVPAVSPLQVEIRHSDLSATQFYLPQKEGYIFDGWYLDPEFKIKVTDGNGYYFRGNTIFYDEGDILYPKWISELNQTYKVLMVFVEESKAQLPNYKQEIFDINYKMPLVERKIYELVPGQFLGYLNKWFNGSVDFEVDTYYVTSLVGSESYSAGTDNYGINYGLFAIDIPELFPILKDYRSTITTCNMNDLDYKLHSVSGIAGQKHACVYMEGMLDVLIINNISLEQLLNINFPNWKTNIDTYLHEFTHTAEIGLGIYDFHSVLRYYAGQDIWGLESTRDYLLNQANIDGDIVGIPFDFWKGNINVTVNSVPSVVDGYSAGKIIVLQGAEYDPTKYYVTTEVAFGADITLQAIPNKGCRFVKWSDGVTTPIRHDTNIISLLNITAIFEKI